MPLLSGKWRHSCIPQTNKMIFFMDWAKWVHSRCLAVSRIMDPACADHPEANSRFPPVSAKLSTRFDPSTRGLTDDHENDL